jgi:hypothetical protein
VQWIKTPARLLADRVGDCKSFTIFVISVLERLNVKYKIRFTSYDPDDPTPTHVYPIALLGNEEIIIDTVWTHFDSEKPYSFKKDYNMSKIYALGSVATDYEKTLNALDSSMPDTLLHNDITRYTKPLVVQSEVSGILDDIKDKAKLVHKKIVNLILKAALPKAAPLFLFVFVVNHSSPEVIKRRNKQLGILKFIADHTGASQSQLLDLIAKGYKSQVGVTPSQRILDLTNGKAKPAVGRIGSFALLLPIIADVIGKILSFFQKKKEDAHKFEKHDTSDETLLGGANAKVQVLSNNAVNTGKKKGSDIVVDSRQTSDAGSTRTDNTTTTSTSSNESAPSTENNANNDSKGGMGLGVGLGVAALLFLFIKK